MAGGKFTDQLTSKDVWTGALLLAIAVELFVNGVFSSWYITHRRFYTILNWGVGAFGNDRNRTADVGVASKVVMAVCADDGACA